MWINFTEDEVDRLRALLHDLSIVGGNGIVVSRQDYAKFAITDERPVRKPVQNGGAAGFTTRVQVALDPAFNFPGGPSTACAFRYFVYAEGVSRTVANQLYPTSVQAYFRRWSIGEHEAARAGSLAELTVLATADAQGRTGPYLWFIPDERLRAEACT